MLPISVLCSHWGVCSVLLRGGGGADGQAVLAPFATVLFNHENNLQLVDRAGKALFICSDNFPNTYFRIWLLGEKSHHS